jgi:hypothetical protein
MKVKKMEYDAATGEYKEIYEEDLPSPEEPEIIQEQTLEERMTNVEGETEILTQANSELTATVDSILTDVLPSLMGM